MYIHGVVVESGSELVVSAGSSVTVVCGSVTAVSGTVPSIVVPAGVVVVGTRVVERLAVRMTGGGVVDVVNELNCVVKGTSDVGNVVVVADDSC